MTESQFASFEAVNAPMFAIIVEDDARFRFEFANQLYLSACGLTREDVVGKCPHGVFETPTSARLSASLLRVMTAEGSVDFEESLGVGAARTPYRTSLTPVADAAGRVHHIVGTCADVSAEQDVLRLRQQLQSALPQAEEFVALAAHDLRAPMRNIQHLSQMLRDSPNMRDEEDTYLLDLLEDVAAKAGALVADVLTHTQATTAPADVVAFDLGAMCRNLCDVLDPTALHNIDWPDAFVEADRMAVQIALRNLLENAIKHGGKPSLNIDITIAAAPESAILITVSDNGRGFDNPAHVFLQTGAFRPESGYGLLGVRRMIVARGGQISVEPPQPERGAIVALSLPGRILKVPVVRKRTRAHHLSVQNRLDAIGAREKD
ncbi:MAG: ATP-binding protein [Roseobacter sp.]